MAAFTNSPLFSTVGVLAASAAFAFAIYSFYPSAESESGAVPIIKAEAAPIKMAPSEEGGMDIPFQDSTIYGSNRMAAAGKIENLLESGTSGAGEVVDKDMLLAQSGGAQNSEMANITESPAFVTTPTPPALTQNMETAAAEAQAAKQDAQSAADMATAAAAEAGNLESALKDESKTENVPVPQVIKAAEAIKENVTNDAVVAAEAVVPAQKAPAMNEPAQSPETLAFVRSVLDKKDAEKNGEMAAEVAAVAAANVANVEKEAVTAARAPAAIEPASGVEGNYSGAKTHYVQLASISERGRADAEWDKLKKTMSAIPGSSGYRVQEAALDKGMFYRIQAGPYTEAQAKDICEAIKAQKPGGCFVVR